MHECSFLKYIDEMTVRGNQGNGNLCKILYNTSTILISSLCKVAKEDNKVPPGMSRPFLGIGMVANTGILDSITLITAGKKCWTEQLHFTHFINDEEICFFLDLTFQQGIWRALPFGFCIIISQHRLSKHNSELLTCSSGNASDSKDATSTLYFPTVGHLTDSGLQKEQSVDGMCEHI